jgi:starch synthase (maltosyl-transferring)
MQLSADLLARTIVIERVSPELDAGRYPVKREVGDWLEVSADIFAEGHDHLAAALRWRRLPDGEWRESPMRHVDNDRWSGSFPLEQNARYAYTIEAWRHHYSTWTDELAKKWDAGQDVASELLEGREMVDQAAARAARAARRDRSAAHDRDALRLHLRRWDEADGQADQVAIALDPPLRDLMDRYPDRGEATRYPRELVVVADRLQARYAAWYEMLPRSQGTDPTRSATLAECARRLPEIRGMGFDVLYLVPIHPIGKTNRKGKNNAVRAQPGDPGSPYAIGSEAGGHDAVEPSLGTLDDFLAFQREVHAHGMEIALDFAIQCSPDHPWVKEHPGWFKHRPDGSVKYAENPPKKYQDIYPVHFYGEDRAGLWQEMKRVVLFWVGHGVKIFRVDNPHTKPVVFWEWLIAEVQRDHPEVIFVSEAFTRPKMMRVLAKAGFTQSYTYFTWRNTRPELTEYLTELTQSEMKEYYRGNLFTNTPDILPKILQTGLPAAFKMRFVLAATLSSLYGIYNGFELCEGTPVPGKEEYLNSEKYEFKVWDWDRPGNIKDLIRRVNRIRAEHPALHEYENLRFHESDSDEVIFYGKMTLSRSDNVFVAVNLDPFETSEATLRLPLRALGIGPEESYAVADLLEGDRVLRTGDTLAVTLDPEVNPAFIFSVERWSTDERTFDYFLPAAEPSPANPEPETGGS